MLDTGSVSEHAQNTGAFPPFDTSHYISQIFWLGLTFGILYFIFSKILLPRLSSAIEERRSRIANDLDSVTRMKNEAETAKQTYEKALSQAREKAHKHAEAVHQATHEEIQKDNVLAETEIEKKQQDAEVRIKKANQKALIHVNHLASVAALEIIGKVSQKEVFKKDIIEKAVAELSPVPMDHLTPKKDQT